MSIYNINNANQKPAQPRPQPIDGKTTEKTERFFEEAFITISLENRNELKNLSEEDKKRLRTFKGKRDFSWRLINEQQLISIHDAVLVNTVLGNKIFDLETRDIISNLRMRNGMEFTSFTSENLQSIISHAKQVAEKKLLDIPSCSKKTKRSSNDATRSSELKLKKRRLEDTAPQHVVQPIPMPVMHAPSSQTSIPSFYADWSLSQQFVSLSDSSYSTSSEFRPQAEIVEVSQALNVEQIVPAPPNFANEASFPNSHQSCDDFFDFGDFSNNSDFSLGEELDEVTALFTHPDGFFPTDLVAALERKAQYDPFS